MPKYIRYDSNNTLSSYSSTHSLNTSGTNRPESRTTPQIPRLEVPDQLISVEALIYIGFNYGVATLIHAEYLDSDALKVQQTGLSLPVGNLFQIAHRYIDRKPDCGSEEDDRDAYLVGMGVGDYLRREFNSLIITTFAIRRPVRGEVG